MKQILERGTDAKTLPLCATDSRGDVLRRIGSIRGVTLKNAPVNADRIFGLQRHDAEARAENPGRALFKID